jgi:hypothetical protein
MIPQQKYTQEEKIIDQMNYNELREVHDLIPLLQREEIYSKLKEPVSKFVPFPNGFDQRKITPTIANNKPFGYPSIEHKSNYDLNNDVDLRNNMIRFYKNSLLKDLFNQKLKYVTDMINITVDENKIVHVKIIDQQNNDYESFQVMTLKVDYIRTKILHKTLIDKILTEVTLEKNMKWYSLNRNEETVFSIKKLIVAELYKILKSMNYNL